MSFRLISSYQYIFTAQVERGSVRARATLIDTVSLSAWPESDLFAQRCLKRES